LWFEIFEVNISLSTPYRGVWFSTDNHYKFCVQMLCPSIEASRQTKEPVPWFASWGAGSSVKLIITLYSLFCDK
jgi:hypothetical protein